MLARLVLWAEQAVALRQRSTPGAPVAEAALSGHRLGSLRVCVARKRQCAGLQIASRLRALGGGARRALRMLRHAAAVTTRVARGAKKRTCPALPVCLAQLTVWT